MNREEFNQLDGKGQVEYFNNELKQESNNFNAICKGIGVSKNTVLSRFKKLGYEPTRQGQKIIEFLQAFGEKEVEKEQRENLISKTSEIKNKTKVSDPYEMNLILKRIELLEQKVKELENEELPKNKNFINSYENTTTKTFKIDVEVYQELGKIFEKYKMYKKQDIVSSIIKIGIDNIK